jgi:hypothetical protein
VITVERILNELATMAISGDINSDWHRNFLMNVQSHAFGGSALSSNQGAIVLKTAGNHSIKLSKRLRVTKAELDSAIASPVYERAPYQSISIPREVRYIGMDKIAFRFKLDNTVVAEIKALKSSTDQVNSAPVWNNQYRLWIVTVSPGNLDRIFEIIQRHKFHFDEPLLEYMTLCSNSKKAISTFAAVDGNVAVANICSNPLLSTIVKKLLKGEPV